MRISDWSSDVCSSDLDGLPEGSMAAGFGDALDQTRLGRRGRLVRGQRLVMPLQGHVGVAADPALELREVLPAERTLPVRSDERRVGKECVSTCRSRWSPYH